MVCDVDGGIMIIAVVVLICIGILAYWIID